MNKALWMKILESSEEDKLASILEGLSDEDKKELSSVYEDEEKTASEPKEGSEEVTEDPKDVEKVAADYYAAGKIFAQGFLDTLNEAGE